jgi:hypothetical protein
LIPEKVFAIRSITTKRAKQFENAFGHFEYISVPTDYFSIGIRQQIVDNEYAYLIATPEKALCDLIIATPNLRIQSVKAMQTYLEDDLRIDFSAFQNIDLSIIKQCIVKGKKKGELRHLLKFLEENKKIKKMEETNRPEVIDIEDFFNEYVEYFGGEVISKRKDNLTDRANADYLFRNRNVIAELKCFQKDLFNDEEDIPRLVNFFKKWEEKGLVEQSDILKIIFGTKQISEECYLDLLNACRNTIDTAIKKANRQIRESKKTFSLPDAKGLVLLCNDGNYFLQNVAFIKLICDLMRSKYMNLEIDGFVFFTVNQVATIPESELDYHLWFPAYRDENDSVLSDFVNELGGKFYEDFYTKKIGIGLMDKIKGDLDEEIVEKLKYMKHIPKNIIYK